MSYYCTLAQAKREVKTTLTTADDALFAYIKYASRRVDAYMSQYRRRPFFEPYDEQRDYRVEHKRVSSEDNTFYMHDDCLALNAVSVAGTVVTSQVVQYPPIDTPFQHLRLTSYSNSWYRYTTGDGAPSRVTVTGTWGYNSDYANAWLTTGALSAGIDDTVTSIVVGTGEGALFSPGQLLQIDLEYLRVTGVSTDTLTVLRGVNGSVASSHLASANVNVWQVEPDVQQVVARQSALLLSRQGAFDSATIDALGVTQYPSDLLVALRAVITGYQYR